MFFPLVLLFTALPLAELYVLIQVGQVIGGLNTLLVVLATGVVGAYLARMEGLRVAFRAQELLQRGEMPAEEMIDGILILLAGVVLVTPGIITDCMGLLILFPPTRRLFKIWLRKQFDRFVARGQVRIYRGPDGPGPL
ncbi:MAG: FxsA family protein [Nitrospirota bacterium]|nr:FxsA family protein [Nitrospirota bacterium]